MQPLNARQGQITSQPVQQPIPEDPNESNRHSAHEGHWNPSYLDDEKPAPSKSVVLDKPSTSKQPEIIVSGPDNQAISSSTISVSANQTAAPKKEAAGEPIYTEVVKSKPKPVEESQIPSSQVIAVCPSKPETPKPEVIEIIIPPTVEVVSTKTTTTTDDGKHQSVSSEMVTSSAAKVEASDSGFHSEMTSSTSKTTFTQMTSSGLNGGEESQIVSSMTAIDSSMNKNASSSEVIGQPIPSTIVITDEKSELSGEVSPNEPPQVEDLTDVDVLGNVGYYDAFKNFIGGLMSTSRQTSQTEPGLEASEDGQMVTPQAESESSARNESSNAVVAESVMSSNTEAIPSHSSTVEENEFVSSQVVVSNSELIRTEMTKPADVELIFPSTTVVSTQSTTNGNDEVTITATKYTSDGPTFLELSDSGLHSKMTSSSSEVISTQITSSSVYSQTEVVSSEVIINSSSKEEVSKTTIADGTFSSSVEEKSSTTSNGVLHSENENKAIESASVTKIGPTITEVTYSRVSGGFDSNNANEIATYTVSEPSN